MAEKDTLHINQITHISKNCSVRTKNIVGIFDFDNATVSGVTNAFLADCQESKKIVTLTGNFPKSFTLESGEYSEFVYLSSLPPSSIIKRTEQSISE